MQLQKINFKKGFTLLELMIVVVIIGILTAVVLVSLNSARSKGQDASIKAQMNSLRTQADLYYSNHGNSYSSLFISDINWSSGDPSVQAILTGINKQGPIHTAGSSATAWAAQVQLREDPTKYICIDASAIFKIGTTVMTGGQTSCP